MLNISKSYLNFLIYILSNFSLILIFSIVYFSDNDYENFLCTLLLPQTIRAAAFAIRAFNVEVALVEDRIKDKQIGLMRMKFWNNVIENIYNKKPAKIPIALELNRVSEQKLKYKLKNS